MKDTSNVTGRQRDLEMAVRLARVGAWSVTLTPLRFHPSREWLEIHDYQQAARVSVTAALRTFQPEGRAALLTRVRECLREGGTFELRLPVITAAGRRTVIRVVGETAFMEGRPALVQGVCQDATERVPQEDESRHLQSALQARHDMLEKTVATTTEQLKGANEELASFASAIAHDVRTPLAIVGGFSHALLNRVEQLGDEKSVHFCRRIQQGIERADDLFRSLLELLRLGQAEPEKRDLDLTAMAQQWVRDMHEKTPERRIRTSIQPGMHALADLRLVNTLVDALLGNAWKFTRDTQDAELSFGQTGEGVFFVRDNGVGFDGSKAGELFRPFKRLHPESEFPGTGVGLASARRVVGRHGGAIWTASQPGSGTTFYFTLAPRDHGT